MHWCSVVVPDNKTDNDWTPSLIILIQADIDLKIFEVCYQYSMLFWCSFFSKMTGFYLLDQNIFNDNNAEHFFARSKKKEMKWLLGCCCWRRSTSNCYNLIIFISPSISLCIYIYIIWESFSPFPFYSCCHLISILLFHNQDLLS